MAEHIVMIALSPTMETGTIGSWVKQEGDDVSSGDVLCEVETDKASMDYESVQEGTLLKILVPEGGSAKIGDPIGIIGNKGEDIGQLISEAESMGKTAESKKEPAPGQGESKESAVPAAASDTASKTAAAGQPPAGGNGHIKSSPLARVLAEKNGIDITSVRGSGPEGRIVKRDIERAVQRGGGTGTADTAAKEAKPISRKRRVIAERLAASKFSAPHYYLKLSVSMDNMLEARKELNRSRSREEKVSLNAFLIKLAAEVLKRHPEVRSSWQEDSIVTFGSIDIGLAVAQSDGLITPVVRDCGSKGIIRIDTELKALIEKAQNNKLTPDEYSGAVFSISNLGSFGIEEFTAIINPPGSAILAVGAIQRKQIFDDTDTPQLRSMMAMTLSCDHRVVDGAVGASFLYDLKKGLENPVSVLL